MVGSDPLRSWSRTVHTHTHTAPGGALPIFPHWCNVWLTLQLGFASPGGPNKSAAEFTKTGARSTCATHLCCVTSTDQDRSKYAHMETDTFDPHGNAGRTCYKEQGGPSRIGETPPFPGLLCLQSHVQWLPSQLSMLVQKLQSAISKRRLGRNPCY